MPPTGLSKSRFCSGLQCVRQLWWRAQEPGAPELVPSAAQRVLFERGHLVGELARRRFPGGVLVDLDPRDVPGRLAATQAALAQDPPAICEASFLADGVFVAVDVLARAEHGWVVVEVKSTLGVKEHHIPDVAVQVHVARAAGLTVRRAELMHLDRACTYPDLSNLFARDDVTEPVEAFLPAVPGHIRRLQRALEEGLPAVEVGPHCDRPYECPFKARCWPALPPHHVSTLYRGGRRAEVLATLGFATLYDLPPEIVLPEIAARQVRAVREGRAVVEPGLADALAALAPPVAYLDFETVMPAVPCWSGCHPYEQVPVQLSCHAIDARGEVRHHAFLAAGPGDPRPALVEALVGACGDARAVVAYNAPFEGRCLAHLAAAVPERAQALEAIRARLVDLLPLVRDHVYHPDFGGGFGMKRVLPALVPGLGYGDLAIAEGGTAQAVLEGLLLRESAIPVAEREGLRRQLLDYCARDTLAMVRLVERLRQLTGLAPPST